MNCVNDILKDLKSRKYNKYYYKMFQKKLKNSRYQKYINLTYKNG